MDDDGGGGDDDESGYDNDGCVISTMTTIITMKIIRTMVMLEPSLLLTRIMMTMLATIKKVELMARSMVRMIIIMLI